jgi:RNA polymerase sigma-70 factor (ECF subfamily)
MIKIFDNRCAFVSKKGVCHQCTTLKGILNPEQDAHIEANRIKMVKDGQSTDKEGLFDLRINIVRAVDPINSPNALLNIFMLRNAEKWVQEGLEKKVL